MHQELCQAYLNAIDHGARQDYEDQSEIYKIKREESIANSHATAYDVIISPSRASYFRELTDTISLFTGECTRHAFFAKHNFPVTNHPPANNIRKMRYGQIFEAQEHIYEKKGGILLHKNYRMQKKVSENIIISGEADTVAEIEGIKFIAEIKSYDGYYAIKHIKGTAKVAGMPKYDHVAQNMFYLAMIRDYIPEIKYTVFHYRVRSDMSPTVHLLSLEEEYDKQGNVIDAYPIINGYRYAFVSLRTLISRSITLAECIRNKKLPPRDPDFSYSEEKIRYLLETGNISKTAYKEWQDGKHPLGDWNCSRYYCRYFDLCMGQTPSIKESLPSNNDIMNRLEVYEIDKNTDTINTIG